MFCTRIFLISLLGLVCFPLLTNAQGIKPPWEVYALYGIEMKDKRVPEQEGNYLKEFMDSYNPKDWGSFAKGIGLQYRWGSDRKLFFSTGLGIEHYVQKTWRYFDMDQMDNGWGYDIYYDTHRYEKWNFFASQSISYSPARFIDLYILFRLNFDMLTEVYYYVDEVDERRFYNSQFGFYGLEAMPGLAINFWRFSVGGNIRTLNFRRVDTILYGPNVFFNIPQYMEFVNPLRINFYTSYRFHSGRQR